jgi:hypothetical protein
MFHCRWLGVASHENWTSKMVCVLFMNRNLHPMTQTYKEHTNEYYTVIQRQCTVRASRLGGIEPSRRSRADRWPAQKEPRAGTGARGASAPPQPITRHHEGVRTGAGVRPVRTQFFFQIWNLWCKKYFQDIRHRLAVFKTRLNLFP